MTAYDAWLDPPELEDEPEFEDECEETEDLQSGDWGSDETEIIRDNRYER